MATITPTQTNAPTGSPSAEPKVRQTVWAAIGDADTCTPVRLPDFTDQTVQFGGTFGGATLTLQGSNDGTTYSILTDPQGNNISVTVAAIKSVLQAPLWIKPVTASGVSSSTTVTLISRR